MKSSAKPHLKSLSIILLGIIVFWLLRLYYWNITVEMPFSDMGDYNSIALRIVKSWDFSHSPFWQSYYSPGLPALRALEIFFLGTDIKRWQIFQTMLLFLGVIWLTRELTRSAKNLWIGVFFIWIIALNKSSIFWSYKIASEGLGEAFVYLSGAASLYTLRKRTITSFFLAGAIYTIGFLIRPNFFATVPLFILFFSSTTIKMSLDKKRSRKKIINESVKLLVSFLLGIFIVWSPWFMRTYKLYGRVVPFNTHGAYTFFWEMGNIPIVEKGKITNINVQKLQSLSETKFRNDYEAMLYANNAAKKWLQTHWKEYPSMIIKRIVTSIRERDVHLTKVSRLNLFPDPINRFLVDKSTITILSGIMGLAFLSLYIDKFLVITMIALSSWLSAVVVLGYPRMLEPVIPIILFGNFGWFYIVRKLLIDNRYAKK